MNNVLQCPRCQRTHLEIERTPGGWIRCLDCGYNWKSLPLSCNAYKPQKPTLFDRITASPEVLAESIVHEECEHSILDANGCGATFPGGYTSAILDFSYGTKSEAIAATVAKLKELAE